MTAVQIVFGVLGLLGGGSGIAVLIKVFVVDRKQANTQAQSATSTAGVNAVNASNEYVSMVQQEIREAREAREEMGELRRHIASLEGWIRRAYGKLQEAHIDIEPPPADYRQQKRGTNG